MKKFDSILIRLIGTLVLSLTLSFSLISCGKTEYKIFFDSDGVVISTLITDGKSKISLPSVPSKSGFTFRGWFFDKDTYSQGLYEYSLIDFPITKDTTVYAKWTPDQQSFYIEFNTNGGTPISSYSASIINSSPLTTRQNYNFLGWYTDSSLDEQYKVQFPYTPAANITLYAKWEEESPYNLKYTFTSALGAYFVTGIEGDNLVIDIPDTYNGYPVKGIQARAFEGNNGISEINIPSSVTTVGISAFSDCYFLEKVYIAGNALEIISSNAFSNCLNLESINLPQSLKSIGGEAFFGCIKLKEINLSSSIEVMGSNALKGCLSLEKLTYAGNVQLLTLLGEIPLNLKTVYIESGVTNIVDLAFLGCAFTEEIIIPDSVTEIGTGILSGCTGLKKLTVPFIGSKANQNNSIGYFFDLIPNAGTTSALEEITITGQNPVIGQKAFYNCTALKRVNSDTDGIFNLGNANGIGTYAFYNCENAQDIRLPQGLTSIGEYTFYGCSNLTKIFSDELRVLTIPSNITSIGEYAFTGCGFLEKLLIADNVIEIGKAAFLNCSTLREISIPFVGKNSTSNKFIGYIFGGETYNNQSSAIPAELKKIVLTGDTSVKNGAFYGCSGVEEIILPDNITSIESNAFYNCSNLKEMVFPQGVANFSSNALYGCSKLQSLTIPSIGNNLYLGYLFGATKYSDNYNFVPSSLKTISLSSSQAIPNYAFYQCWYVENIYLDENINSIGEYAFYQCEYLENISLSADLKLIGKYAFSRCQKLQNIEIPYGIETVEDYTFSNCHNLYKVEFAEGSLVKKIGTNAFEYCKKLIEINLTETQLLSDIRENAFIECLSLEINSLPDNITQIGYNAFLNIKNYQNADENSIIIVGRWLLGYMGDLTEVTLPENITMMADYAFYGCDTLTKITITGNMSKIVDSAFFYCSSLSTVVLPETLKNIGSAAFMYCTALSEINLPDSVEEISPLAFYQCLNLETISFGNNLIRIGMGAFNNCTSLLKLTFPSTLTYIDNNAFAYCTSLSEINFSEGSNLKIIEYNAFINCKFVQKINLPESVETINSFAFENCLSLSQVVFAENSKLSKLGEGVFKGCISLTEIVLTDSLTTIGASLFSGCYNLTKLSLPFVGGSRSATGANTLFGYIFGTSQYTDSVSVKQFYSSSSYQSYYLPSNLKSVIITSAETLKYGAFYNCDMIEEITLPSTLTVVENMALDYDHRFIKIYALTPPTIYQNNYMSTGTKIYVPEEAFEAYKIAWADYSKIIYSLSSIYDNFATADVEGGVSIIQYLGNESSVIVPLVINGKDVIEIGKDAFWRSSYIVNITLQEGIKTIGESTFYYCSNLERITIPSTITKIKSYAFYNTPKLIHVTMFAATLPSIEDYAFSSSAQLKIYVPASSVDAYKNLYSLRYLKSQIYSIE